MGKLLLSFLSLLFLGCSVKQNYIYIPQPNVTKIKRYKKALSIKEVSLPYYLKDAKIAYIDGKTIKFYDNYFSDDATEFATKRVKQILKEALSTQNISIYPWGDDKSDILEVEVTKFISDGKRVYLNGSWKLYDRKKHIKHFGTFKKAQKIDKDVASIMKELFDDFIVDIAKRI